MIEKEALGLIWALPHFDFYVGGTVSLVDYSDHNPLTFLRSLMNHSAVNTLLAVLWPGHARSYDRGVPVYGACPT